jgi:YfiH family protein
MLFEPEEALSEKLLCFTTSIYGGVSKHNYFSFNLGAHVGDKQASVAKNRTLLDEKLAKKCRLSEVANKPQVIQPIKWLEQQHTSYVSDYATINSEPCDGIFTNEHYVPLAIMTADCMPIVVYGPSLKELAVVHAGWRGLLDGVIQSGLGKFSKLSDVKVWIGPSISQSHFEVSHDVIHYFDAYHKHVKPCALQGKWKICLPNIAQDILGQHDIHDVQIAPECTYQNKDFFSHRRAGHTGFSQTGRMATVAMMIK